VHVTVEDGLPAAVGQVGVFQVREEWRVVDRWWTDAPVRRRYFDLVLRRRGGGRLVSPESLKIPGAAAGLPPLRSYCGKARECDVERVERRA